MAFETTGVQLAVIGLGSAQRSLAQFDASINRVNTAVGRMGQQSLSASQRLFALGDAMTNIGRNLTIGLTLPITAAATALTGFGIGFEDAFAGILKTVEEATDPMGNLTADAEALRASLIDMSTEVPIAATELARIGEVSGQLGVALGEGGKELEGFIHTVALLAETTDFTSEEAAFAIARLANIMGIEAGNMSAYALQVGNAIVELGNNTAATEPEIQALALRIAGAGRAVKLTTPQILGLSASLAEAGIRAELGGSAVSRILQTLSFAANDYTNRGQQMVEFNAQLERSLQGLAGALSSGNFTAEELINSMTNLNLSGLAGDMEALARGTTTMDEVLRDVSARTRGDFNASMAEATKQIRTFASVTGLTEDSLVSLIKTDPTEAFFRVLSGLADMQEQGTLTSSTLGSLELNTIRLRDVINRLGPNTENIADNIALANNQWSEQTALTREAERRFATVRSQLVLLANEFKAFGISLFDQFNAPLVAGIKALRGFVGLLTDASPAVKTLIVTVGGITAALGPGILILGTLTKVLALNTLGVGKLVSAFTDFASLGFFRRGVGGIFKNLFGGNENPAEEIAQAVTGGERGFIGRIRKIISDGLTKANLGKIFSGYFGNILGSLGSIGNSIQSTFGSIISSIANKFPGTVAVIASSFFRLSDAVGETFGKARTFVLDTFSDIANKGLDVFNAVANKIPSFFSKAVSKVGSSFSYLSGLITDIASGAIQGFSLIGTAIIGPISAIGGLIGSVLLAPLKAVGALIGDVLLPVIGEFGKTAFSVFSGLGKKLLSFVPGLANFLFSGLFGIIPKLAIAAALGLALVIGPDLIKAVAKNWDALLERLNASFKQFVEDVKNVGLEDAILLFVSGGSAGSGRLESLFGIASALGASEEAAQRFSYAIGETVATVIKLVKEIGNLITGTDDAASSANDLNNGMGRTSRILVGLAEGIADFTLGFREGFVSTFDDIRQAFGGLRESFNGLRAALGEFFGTIFDQGGRVERVGREAGEALTTGVGQAGLNFGEIIGEVITFTIEALTVITNLATAITNAFTGLAEAYQQNGIRGVFEELLSVISVVWDELRVDLVSLIQPQISALVAWLTGTGGTRIINAVRDIAFGLESVFNQLWSGFDPTEQFTTQNVATIRRNGAIIGRTTADDFFSAWENESQLRLDNGTLIDTSQIGTELQATVGTQNVSTGFSGGFGGLQETFNNLVGNISDFLSSDDTKNTISSAFNSVWSVIATFIRDEVWGQNLLPAFNSLIDSFSMWVDTVAVPTIEGTIDYIAYKALQKFRDLSQNDTIRDAFNLIFPGSGTVLDNITGLFDAITGNAADVDLGLSDFVNASLLTAAAENQPVATDTGTGIGQNLMVGAGDGVHNNREYFLNELEDANNSAVNLLYTTWDIQSPSGVTRDIGANIIDGLVLGISTQRKVLSAILTSLVSEFSVFSTSLIKTASIIANTLSNMQLNANNTLTNLGKVFQELSSKYQLPAQQAYVPSTTVPKTGSTYVAPTTTTNNTQNKTFAPSYYTSPTREVTEATKNLYEEWVKYSP